MFDRDRYYSFCNLIGYLMSGAISRGAKYISIKMGDSVHAAERQRYSPNKNKTKSTCQSALIVISPDEGKEVL